MNKWFKTGNVNLFYRDEGQGSPVVLVHGFGEDGNIWGDTVTAMKHQFRFIVPDLPGSGLSPLPANTPLSMELLAEQLQALLLELQISQVIMIGHSMGGYITLAYAEAYPANLKGFGLYHSSAFADDAEKIANRRKGIEFIRQHGASKFLAQTTPNLFSPEFRAQYPERVAEQINLNTNFSDEALVQYYEAMIRRPDRSEVLRSATVPVLFILGKHDNAIPLEMSLKQCHLPRFSDVTLLEHSGHLGMIEENSRATGSLQKYLAEIEIA